MDREYHRIPLVPEMGEVQPTIPQIRTSAKLQGSKRKHHYGFSLYTWSHIFGFIWIVPITALLTLNFKSHVIGASIWCPRGRCNAEAYGENAIAKARKLDAKDHNIFGALQLVSKALEAWFMLVATGLVYDVAFYMAKKRGGLPIGYLFTHLEFAHIRNLANPLLWTSALPHGNLLLPMEHAHTWKLYMFVILAAFLTLLTNLMGPAAAVLVLPSLKWVDEEHLRNQVFGAFAASSPPKGEIVLPGCNDTQFAARNYTCTSAVYGPSLDHWFTQLLSTTAQAGQRYGMPMLGTTQEGAVETTINGSRFGNLIWIPNRQVLRDLSRDLIKSNLYVTGGMEPNKTAAVKQPAFNNSLETVLQREGPSLGMAADCFVGNLTVKDVADDRQIRCLGGWNPAENNTYTKCFRAGRGWAETNEVARFSLGDADDGEEDSSVEVYSSDKATYFDETAAFGSRIQDCMQEGASDCDWKQLFDTEIDADLKNTTTNALVTEHKNPLNSSSRFWCESFVYTAFPIYTVNTAQSSNPLMLTPIAVHPDWVLAAWSVANNGTVSRSRQVGKEVARLIPLSYDGEVQLEDMQLFLLYIYSMAQSLSLIDYSYINVTTFLATATKAEVKGELIFHTWATLRVWAYGIKGRTPMLGVVIAILGCICVLLRVVLAVSLGLKHEHSTLELFVAALEHHPTGEFDGLDDKAAMAKVRYLMEDGEKRPKFVSEREYSAGKLKGGHIA